MRVTFKISPDFNRYLPAMSHLTAEMECPVKLGDTVADLLDAVGFPQEVAVIVFLNGKRVSKEMPMNDNDSVFLQVVMGGG